MSESDEIIGDLKGAAVSINRIKRTVILSYDQNRVEVSIDHPYIQGTKLEREARTLADEDDFTHYFNGCMRLTKENGELRAEIERLTALMKDQRAACIKIVRESLDTGEYERSLGKSIITRIKGRRALENKP
jgi:hypothetical protein